MTNFSGMNAGVTEINFSMHPVINVGNMQFVAHKEKGLCEIAEGNELIPVQITPMNSLDKE